MRLRETHCRRGRNIGYHRAPLAGLFWAGLIGLPVLAAPPPTTQEVLDQMHETNELGLLQGQQSNLDLKQRQLEQRRTMDQSLDQATRDAELPRLNSKEVELESQQKALSAKKKQLGKKIPKPPPITSVEP
ncbi:MAG: hypothetical protein ACXVCI_09100 [Bdellovibrionota bacterium]